MMQQIGILFFAHVYVLKNESESVACIEFANAIIFSFVLKIHREFYCDCWMKYLSTVQTGSEINKLRFFRIRLHHILFQLDYVCTFCLVVDAINRFLILILILMIRII